MWNTTHIFEENLIPRARVLFPFFDALHPSTCADVLKTQTNPSSFIWIK